MNEIEELRARIKVLEQENKELGNSLILMMDACKDVSSNLLRAIIETSKELLIKVRESKKNYEL